MSKRLNPHQRKRAKRRNDERKALIQRNVEAMPELKAEARQRVRSLSNPDQIGRHSWANMVAPRPHRWTPDDAFGVAGTVAKGKVKRAKVDRTNVAAVDDLSRLGRELRAAEAAGMTGIKFVCPECKRVQTPLKGARFFPTGRVDEKGKPIMGRVTTWHCGAGANERGLVCEATF